MNQYGRIIPGDGVIAAVSGGADSVCLLHLLARLSPEFKLRLMAAHFNHRLRGEESDSDEEFVSQMCRRLDIEFRAGGADVRKIAAARKGPLKGSLEEVCREERYAFLLSVLRESGFSKIALGHNLDDQAETVLMNVLRGTGIDGLKGMEPVRECYIRPLLGISRSEIERFLAGKGIPFRSDSSNTDESYRRNSIRNRLLPCLERHYNPSVKQALARLAGTARLENDFMEAAALRVLSGWVPLPGGGFRADVAQLLECHEAVQRRALKTALEGLSPVRGGMSGEHIEAVLGILRGPDPGASAVLPFRIVVRREYGSFVLARRVDMAGEYEYIIEVPGRVAVRESGTEFRFALLESAPADISSAGEDGKKAYLDFFKLAPPLVIRNMRPGDRIQPFGMKGHKKLQDIFTDRKVPRGARRRIPLLADSDSVLWVPGVVTSERARVTRETESVLSVEKV